MLLQESRSNVAIGIVSRTKHFYKHALKIALCSSQLLNQKTRRQKKPAENPFLVASQQQTVFWR
jgi:hypothetical protein